MNVMRAVLLHDAAEAFIGDCVKPLKLLLPEYQQIEARIESAIAKRFDVSFETHTAVIKQYDRAMLKAEKLALWPDDHENWAGFESIPTTEVEFFYWSPGNAEFYFMQTAIQLGLS